MRYICNPDRLHTHPSLLWGNWLKKISGRPRPLRAVRVTTFNGLGVQV